MKTIIYLLFLLIIFVSISCEKDDQDDSVLTKSSQFNTEINIKKRIHKDGQITDEISVRFEAQGKYVHVRNGYVKTNNTRMSRGSIIWSSRPVEQFYSSNDTVKANKEYNFEIQLSDGTVYNYAFYTQENDLNELSLPINHSREDDLVITWNKPQPTEGTYIEVVKLESGSSGGFVTTFSDVSTNITCDEFTLPSSIFEYDTNNIIDRINVTVINEKTDTLSSNLNGTITSLFQIEAECDIR